MVSDQAFVDQMIQNQRSAIRSYFLFSGVVVSAGFVLLVFGFVFAPDAAKVAFETGGALVGAVATFPIKELIGRKDKLGIFETIRARLQTYDFNQAEIGFSNGATARQERLYSETPLVSASFFLGGNFQSFLSQSAR